MGLVRRVGRDIKNYGRVKIGRSGLLTKPLSLEDRRQWSGARVARIIPGSAAEASDLEVGDIVTSIDDRSIVLPSDVRTAIFMRRPGDTLSVRYIRDGNEAETALTLKAGR
jgi:Trypsin-like serine proteases, typically periplasmic, contain C-terminal PDZ domain